MELRIVGCHGGETPKHRTSAFVLDGKLAIDAGALTRGLELEAQLRLEACLVSHAHLDHMRDLATIADNRFQADCDPLVVAATRGTIAALKKHFFNNVIWPDFSELPNTTRPAIRFVELEFEKRIELVGYGVRAVEVAHTIETSGFIIETPSAALGYSGDTGPTDRLWELLDATPNLKALLVETSFPNAEQGLATVSGHHTPQSLAADLAKLGKAADIAALLYHIKPVFQREVEQECARLRGFNVSIPKLDEQFVF